MKSRVYAFIFLTLFTTLSAQEVLPTVAGGFTTEWLEGRTLYSAILDTEDDDGDGNHTDYILVAAKYEGGYRVLDFSADGSFDTNQTASTYEVVNGDLNITDGGDWEAETITAVDPEKLTVLRSVSWGEPNNFQYDFFTKSGAASYKLFLELAGKKLSLTDGKGWTGWVSLYSNMTKAEPDNKTGTWSVENGVLILDTTFSPANKNTSALVFRGEPLVGTTVTYNATQTGNSETGNIQITAIENLTDDVVPAFAVSIDMLKGKTILNGAGEKMWLYQNMTYAMDTPDKKRGIWSVENGVLVTDTTSIDGNKPSDIDTNTRTFLFDAEPANDVNYTVYSTQDGVTSMTNTITAINDISDPDPYYTTYDNTPVPYAVTVEELAGKKMRVSSNSETIYFYKNMTYKITGIDTGDNTSYELTGTWSVENGVAIADVTMSASESEQRVYVFDAAPAATSTFTNYLTLAADPVVNTNVVIESFTNIESLNPSVIMYLLN